MLKKIQKRNGQVVLFKSEKITNAIYKASFAVGEADWHLAETLSKEVANRLAKKLKKGGIPAVEEIQDVVEQVLIDTAHAKIAKAYILYRQHRAEIRLEKQQVLNKSEIDEVDKKFDLNALRVMAARYLKKAEDGSIIESPKELFSRVATNVAIPSLFYDSKIYQKRGGSKEHKLEDFDYIKNENKYSIGKYKLNQFHLEAIHRIYKRFSQNRKVKVSFSGFLGLLKKGYFDKYESEINAYFDLMVSRKFFPNTPAIANFGNYLGQGSACFTLGIEDSIDSIMDTLKAAAVIFKSGGGCGYNFSKLRPEGDFVKTTGGVASGPISFMSMFDNMTAVIKQGGIRRGANMGILNSNHPDIEKFVHAKEGNKGLKNFNISVMLMPDFWEAYKDGKSYNLVNPKNGKEIAQIDAQKLFDLIAYQAWESAEPGVLFHDRINEFNPFLKHLGPIDSTNPCSEVLLYPYESCNLGSINVWAYVKKNNGKKTYFDWQKFEEDIKIATRFLDGVIDANKYPMPEIEEMTLNTRKLGFGIMGLADLLIDLEISYNSQAGFDFMEKIMEFVNYHTKVASMELAKERGKMPYFDKSFYKEGKLPFAGFKDKKSWHFDWLNLAKKIKKNGIRNGFTTVVAPTGSLSMLAGCSSGIEPIYSLVFEKSVAVGNFYYVDPVFEEKMYKEGLMDEALIKDIATYGGSVQAVNYIPPKLKKIFVTAMDIPPRDHVKALAVLQKWVDASISKTNNLPSNATVDDVKEIYLLAYKLGCKGVAIYRDKSLQSQVLIAGSKKGDKKHEPKDKDTKLIPLKDEKAKGLSIYHEAGTKIELNGLGLSPAPDRNNSDENGFSAPRQLTHCPSCKTKLVIQEGCRKCPSCGWGLCA